MILGIDPKVDYAFKKLFGSEAWFFFEVWGGIGNDGAPRPAADAADRASG